MQVRQITFLVTIGLFWPGLAQDAQFTALPSTRPAVRFDSVRVLPEPLLIPSPGYIRTAFQAGTEGLAVVEVLVAATGAVSSVRVTRSSLDSKLDAAAVSAARVARFTPGMLDGRPVSTRLALQYFFTRKGPVFYTTVTIPGVTTANIGTLPEPVSVPDPAVCDSVLWLKLPVAVAVTVRVDSLGSVTGAEVASSSGNQLVDRKAKEFALQAKFKPATTRGEPAMARVKIEYEFRQFRTYVSRRRILPADWSEDDIAPTARQR